MGLSRFGAHCRPSEPPGESDAAQCHHGGMSRHGRRAQISPVIRHRVVTGLVVVFALGAFTSAWANRSDHEAALMWLGWGVFLSAICVVVGSLSIGPRPLRSLGVGAWLLVAALGAFLVWTGRDAIDTTARRGSVIAPVMLLLAMGLVPLAGWLMVWRPEQNWEKEVRFERERALRDGKE